MASSDPLNCIRGSRLYPRRLFLPHSKNLSSTSVTRGHFEFPLQSEGWKQSKMQTTLPVVTLQVHPFSIVCDAVKTAASTVAAHRGRQHVVKTHHFCWKKEWNRKCCRRSPDELCVRVWGACCRRPRSERSHRWTSWHTGDSERRDDRRKSPTPHPYDLSAHLKEINISGDVKRRSPAASSVM